jgi:hypothetical protein
MPFIFVLMNFRRTRRNGRMKSFSPVLLSLALAISAGAQMIINPDSVQPTIAVTDTNALAADTNAPGQMFPASAATLTAPLVLTNDYFYLTGDQAEVTNGGKAVISFNITNAGDYVVETLVNANDESTNSFFANVDATPSDEMIWDIEVTAGFEKRMVNWRGTGDSGSDEFSPKRFTLTPGAHTLVIVGREPGVQLKSITIRPAPPAPPTPPATPAPAAAPATP